MPRGYRRPSNLFLRLIKFVERTLLTIIVVGFILLVSVQMILTNPKLKDSLIAKIPKFDKILAIGQSNDFEAETKPVFSLNQEEYLVLSLPNKEAHPEVKLLLNGEVVADFSKGYVKVDINENDYVTIDARELDKGLWFEVTGLSSKNLSFEVGQQFWIDGEFKNLGKIKGLNKF